MLHRLLPVVALVACMANPLARLARAEQSLSLDPLAAATRITPSVLALDTQPAERPTFSLELPIWTAGLDGNIGVRGFTSRIQESFLDLLDKTDSLIGLELRPELRYGAWTFYADGLYLKLGIDDISPGRSTLKFKQELVLVDAGIYYHIGTWNIGPPGGAFALGLDVGPGVRYMHVGLHLDTARGAARSQTQDWADPLAAMQVTLDLDKHWGILTRADVGGGVCADLTWSAALIFSYRFAITSNISASLSFGYKAVAENYHNGSGNQRFTWDAVMHGPILGAAVEF